MGSSGLSHSSHETLRRGHVAYMKREVMMHISWASLEVPLTKQRFELKPPKVPLMSYLCANVFAASRIIFWGFR